MRGRRPVGSRLPASPRALAVVYASAGLIGVVNLVALVLGPGGGARPVLLLCAAVAGFAAYRSVTDDTRALTIALLTSVPQVVSLLAGDSPTWLVGPLGALLLVAGELNVLGWELRGAGPAAEPPPRRLAEISLLGAVGVAASLAIPALTPAPLFGGALALLLAAAALVIVARVVFQRM